MTILQAFGARNPDGTPSPAARERYITLYEEYSQNGESSLPFPCIPKTEPNPYHVNDLRDVEKYEAWHSRWIDGAYKSVLETLDGDQGFVIPVFDPTGVAAAMGMDIPDLDLASIIGSFAVPQAAVPALLQVKPPDIPDFLSGLGNLVKPPIPPIPKLPEIPKLPDGTFLFGGDGIPGFPSLEGFNLAFFTSIPNAFGSLLEQIANPGWWATFTPAKLFEAACKAIQEIAPAPSTDDAPSYQASVAALTTMAGEAMAAHAAGKIVGATALLQKMGEKKGYLVKKTETTDLDKEAMLNNLYRLQSNEINMAVLFPQRNMSYGDQFTLDTIYALADHLNIDTSYRSSEDEESMTLEVGNITGKDKVSGWRNNSWSRSHGGTSFDIAYPMRDGGWISGVAQNNVLEGSAEGSINSSPFKCGQPGNASVPFTINGKLAHDFPAMYEIGRWLFHDWMPRMISENRFLPWTDGGPRIVPYRTILIGLKVGAEFSSWAEKKYGTNWNTSHTSLYKGPWKLNSSAMFTLYGDNKKKEPAHEDHMHFAGQRTRCESGPNGKVYRCNPQYEKDSRYTTKEIQIDDDKTYNARI
jgi:hypothetical protein